MARKTNADGRRDGWADGEHAAPPSRSRRAFVFLGTLAATALASRAVEAQRPVLSPRRRIAEPDPNRFTGRPLLPNEAVAAPADWQNPRLRLVRRVTNG